MTVTTGAVKPEEDRQPLESVDWDEVGVTVFADHMNPEQVGLDIRGWLSGWRGAFSHACCEPAANREGLRYEFRTACRKDGVLNAFLRSGVVVHHLCPGLGATAQLGSTQSKPDGCGPYDERRL